MDLAFVFDRLFSFGKRTIESMDFSSGVCAVFIFLEFFLASGCSVRADVGDC